jgi:hypothetical protein
MERTMSEKITVATPPSATVLSHPAFDRPPVVNVNKLRPGPKRGVVSIGRVRQQRRVRARQDERAALRQGASALCESTDAPLDLAYQMRGVIVFIQRQLENLVLSLEKVEGNNASR